MSLSDVQDGYCRTPDGTWLRWVPAPDAGTTTGVERGVWRALDDCVLGTPT